jgi:hypothetical protein
MKAVVAGTDTHDIGAALASAGVEVSTVDVANRPGLEAAGVHEADLYVLTEARQATSISVAKDLDGDLHVVVYAEDSLPDFARGQADLVIDPELLDPAAVAEELAA